MGLMLDLKKTIESDEKNFGKENVPFMHKSDFQVFDYLNGQLDYSKNGEPIFNVGIDAGKSIMVVGKPGSGKSTFAYQYAYSIMKKYKESTMYIMDFENAFKDMSGKLQEQMYLNWYSKEQLKDMTLQFLKFINKMEES